MVSLIAGSGNLLMDFLRTELKSSLAGRRLFTSLAAFSKLMAYLSLAVPSFNMLNLLFPSYCTILIDFLPSRGKSDSLRANRIAPRLVIAKSPLPCFTIMPSSNK